MLNVFKKKLIFLWVLFFFSGEEIAFAEEWPKIYLTSYPRSGNHWVRYLVEEASSLATASVYCDPAPCYLKKSFPWGYSTKHGYNGHCKYPKKNERVLLKTHFPALSARKFDGLPYLETIRIVRHPVESFHSYYLYQNRKKHSFPETIPRHVLIKYIAQWRLFQEYWNNQPNVITFLYEDMLKDPFPILYRILETLQYQPTEGNVHFALEKFPPLINPVKIDRFTKEDLELIEAELKDLMLQFGYDMTKYCDLVNR